MREWLIKLGSPDSGTIGEDIKAVEFGWPRGHHPPTLVKNLDGPICEVRSHISSKRIARTLNAVIGSESRNRRKPRGRTWTWREHDQSSFNEVPSMASNKHPGSRFDSFLEREGMLQEVEATAIKRVLASEVADYLTRNGVPRSAFAKRIHTSPSQLDRLLDAENPSVTLHTMVKSARGIGRKFELHLD